MVARVLGLVEVAIVGVEALGMENLFSILP